MTTDIVIAGFGSSAIARKSERSILGFAQDAILAALKDAGLSRDEVDGYIGAPFATNAGSPHAEGGDEVCAKTIAPVMGFTRLSYATDLYRRYPADMVMSAAHALIAGECRYVVGMRALYNIQGLNYATAEVPTAYGSDQFIKPFAYNIAGARFAARAQRYMAQNNVTRDDLYEVVALARRHAALNPQAIWKDKSVSREAYLGAQMIATPHGLFDCDMPVCGAGAFVMCRAEDLPTGATPAYVSGWAGFQRPERVFEMAGLTPADVTQAQLYDGFSTMIYEWLEAFGLCPKGEAARFIRDGQGNLDGTLPLNTFGGSLGEGRLHGIGHLREAYLQTAHKAGARQVAKSGPCLVQIGPYDDSAFVMLTPEPRRRVSPTT
ncbi:thiolase family protein [Celeribacter neptunius]|uniref:Acetyl-CoA acetyltransferase n=1 Tax=Celeribacter neptunius TaxID=588602 RepID=A0A1I3XV33_9RHOB|nr:thiolase family protein [Celeribacter neptunius]SFK23428.1 Acetyl-CoA acetyltransferase [Celeribacter neptunius]